MSRKEGHAIPDVCRDLCKLLVPNFTSLTEADICSNNLSLIERLFTVEPVLLRDVQWWLTYSPDMPYRTRPLQRLAR